MYYKQTKEGEGWPEVEVGGEGGGWRGVTYWLRGEHIGEKPTGAEIGIGGVILIAESGESSKTLKHETLQFLSDMEQGIIYRSKDLNI